MNRSCLVECPLPVGEGAAPNHARHAVGTGAFQSGPAFLRRHATRSDLLMTPLRGAQDRSPLVRDMFYVMFRFHVMFHVADGEVAFRTGDLARVAMEGGRVAIPDGVAPGFRAIGDRPARPSMLNAPWVMCDGLCTGIGTPLSKGPRAGRSGCADPAAILVQAEAAGITILPPRAV